MKSPEMLAARASCGFPRPALSTATFDVSPPPVGSGGGLSSSPFLVHSRKRFAPAVPVLRARQPGVDGRERRPGSAELGRCPHPRLENPGEGARLSSLSKDREGRQGRLHLQTHFLLLFILLGSTHIHMVKNSNRTKGCTCKQVFEYILLGALFKECLCTWISGLREGPLWVCVLTDPGRQFPDLSTSADNFSLGFSAPLLSSSSPCFPGRAAPFSARF